LKPNSLKPKKDFTLRGNKEENGETARLNPREDHRLGPGGGEPSLGPLTVVRLHGQSKKRVRRNFSDWKKLPTFNSSINFVRTEVLTQKETRGGYIKGSIHG